jgi:hypothetical protein
MKNIILIFILLCLASCYGNKFNIATMPKPPKEGPPEYIEGWKDGCSTGLTTYSNSFYRTKYKTMINGHKMENLYYHKGWELGQRHCSYYSSTYLSNNELSRVSGDFYANKDLRSDNTWFSLKSDGFFSYEGFDIFN